MFKKISSSTVLVLIFGVSSIFAQIPYKEVKSNVIESTTVINSSTTTGYVTGLFGGNNAETPVVQSVGFRIYSTGEIDLDTVFIHKGNMYDGTFYANSVDTVAVTVDNATGVITVTGMNPPDINTELADLAACDAIQISIQAAASGNDATDPNALWVDAVLYYVVE